MAPKPTIVCQYHHHHHAFYLYMLSRGTDISKHTSSQNNYLTLHNFTITVTFLSCSLLLNILALLFLYPQSTSSARILKSLQIGVMTYHTGNKLLRDITDTADEHKHAERTPKTQRTPA